MIKLKFTSFLLLVGIYLATTGIAFATFRYFLSPQGQLVSPVGEEPKSTGFGGLITVNPQAPKTEICPTNGEKFTKDERTAWELRRPIVAMIENHLESRPQSGLTSADIVYEAVAEGGITRFMGVFYCRAMGSGEKIAPVRSARIYFVNIAAEYNVPMYVHVGGGNCSRDEATKQCVSDKRAWAIEELAKLGWRYPGGNDIDTTADAGVPMLKRDYNRLGVDVQLATEHTMIGSLSEIWKEAADRGFTNKMEKGGNWWDAFKSWKFAEGKASQGTANKISFSFWDGTPDFDVIWDYDSATNTYKRTMGGKPHVDLENQQQVATSTILIQFVKEEGPIDPNMHMLYGVIGSGDALIFQNGTTIKGLWKKAKQLDRTIFTDAKGKEIEINPGQIWVEILPKGNTVTY